MKLTGSFYRMVLACSLLCFGWISGMDASAADQNPCSKDVAKFCGNIAAPGPAGMIAVMDCLEEHEKELSAACRDFEAGMGGSRVEKSEAVRAKRQFRQNCMSDMARFCQNAGPMQGGMMKCLSEHENELSAPCNQSIKTMR